ncbi:hypothetical protein ABZ297_13915 [Nonomuraea sp. NPDC005983]|uniref:hypothetical protein n=1 Tax=Nonomuraea sp. NPDC005983 TaxID=3155595 RepID=UPI0033BD7EC2
MLEEAPEVDDLEYYPALMAVFVPNNGAVPDSGRVQRALDLGRLVWRPFGVTDEEMTAGSSAHLRLICKEGLSGLTSAVTTAVAWWTA